MTYFNRNAKIDHMMIFIFEIAIFIDLVYKNRVAYISVQFFCDLSYSLHLTL